MLFHRLLFSTTLLTRLLGAVNPLAGITLPYLYNSIEI